jgi:hypothetical protein
MNDSIALLLCDPAPSLRARVLRELVDAPPDDAELVDLVARRRAMAEVQLLMATETHDLRELSWTLCRLAHLGFDRAEPGVARIAEALFDRQLANGSFPLAAFGRSKSEPRYSMIPLQVALPLRGLAAVGYATDPRAERAYDWLLDQRLDDGAWPLGTAAGQPGYIAGYRRLPGSKGCRVNTQAAIACLALHPERRRTPEARAALDLLLQRETRDEWALGTEIARLTGTDPVAGFITSYGRFDLAFILELASRIGASVDDPRVGDLVAFLGSRRGAAGLWEHPERPELGRWLTFEILLSLRRLDAGDWAGGAPRLPFRPLVRGPRR